MITEEKTMANTHISTGVKDRLINYCNANELTPSQGIDSLISKVATLEKENQWLSKLVSMHEAMEDRRMEGL